MNILREVVSECGTTISHACALFDMPRSNFYYRNQRADDSDIANEIYDIWQENQFYGYRKITAILQQKNVAINHKKVLRLMQQMGIYALVPAPHTSKKANHNQCEKFPYLLGEMEITAPNQAWQTDITYIKMPLGFMYLLAFIDVFSRYLVSFAIGNTMDGDFAEDALKSALLCAKPELVNSDHGSQFTCKNWISMLKDNDVKISISGVGRCIDNVYIERFWRSLKVEQIYLNPPDNVKQLRENIKQYVEFYNHKRPHQALNYNIPARLYKSHNNQKIIPI